MYGTKSSLAHALRRIIPSSILHLTGEPGTSDDLSYPAFTWGKKGSTLTEKTETAIAFVDTAKILEVIYHSWAPFFEKRFKKYIDINENICNTQKKG
jgi:hypothetical protein